MFGFKSRLPAVAGLALLAAASAAPAAVVFGSFEGSQPDGFGVFNNGVVPFPAAGYTYGPAGATAGTTSLHVDLNGGFQSNALAYDFHANTTIQAAFFANSRIEFDFSFPVSATTGGYAQVYNIALNSPGGGYTTVGAVPLANQSPPYTGQINHVVLDYSAFRDATLAGAGGANPNYLQLNIALNSGGGAPSAFYFDNFQLTSVPEPTSLGLAGLAASGLVARRRRR